MIYLDHNATSPLRPEARDAMARALEMGGNASSVHAAGRAARAVVEDARVKVAALTGAAPADILFTGGGTEANATALFGAVQGAAGAEARITRLFVSAIEHDSVLANAAALSERTAGLRLEIVPVTPDGVVDLAELARALREGKGRALVAVMAANNETGVVQPIAEVAALVRETGALLLVDAVQAAGKMPLAFDADYITVSAHKLGGPQGAGALAVKPGAPFAPLIAGGGQERGLRAGTENMPGIAGFGAVAALSTPDNRTLRDRFEAELLRAVPDAVIFGRAAPRLGNTSCFALPGIPAETSLIALDLDGVMASSGAACSSGTVKPSHVLKAMGVEEELARCALRVSLGWNSVEDDITAAVAAITNLVGRVRARKAA